MSLKPETVDFDLTWGRLRQTLENVIKVRGVNRKEWTGRFSDVYKLCVSIPEPYCDKLYYETRMFIDNHVTELHDNIAYSEPDILRAYYLEWEDYKNGIRFLNDLYLYLNTQHIRKQKFSDADITYGCADINEQKLEISELGYYFWEKNMIEPLKDQLIRLILRNVKDSRKGRQVVNEPALRGAIMSFVEVETYKKRNDLYREVLEKPFLRATGSYYKADAEQLLRESDCSQYIEKVLQRLADENMRSRKFLHPSSFPKVKEECEGRMIADHLAFLHSECKSMVVNEKRHDLKNLYTLLKNVDNGLGVLINEVQEHITAIGLNAVTGHLCPEPGTDIKENHINFVESVLDVHKKFSLLISEVFSGDQQFVGALDKACSAVINYRKNQKIMCKAPELLSRYCDSLLKKSAAKCNNESDIDDKLTNSITVFKYVYDKDVFQKFYAKMLAKRLIHSLSVSMECEESMINKLKQACGHEFTSKLHRMFTDIKVSDDLNNNFSSWCKNSDDGVTKDLGGINFNMFVLQAGAWPLSQTSGCAFAIPVVLEKCVSNFEAFYSSKFNGRRLTWLHFLSVADVKVSLTERTYLVTMDTYYMGILLLFESVDTLTYQYLSDNTKLGEEQLIKHINGLLESRLLIQDNTLLPINAAEATYTVNTNFTSKRTKFKVTAIANKEQTQQVEVEQTHASVDEDRKLYLQAAIVRIMKARKVIKHNALIQEIILQSKNRFNPSISMIKKCIEALMEKQYLERTNNTTDEYSYVA